MIRLTRAGLQNVVITVAFCVAGMIPVVAAAATADGHEYVVPMSNMSYGTIPSGLKVGDSIVWVNRDSVPHTVTARDHSFDLRIGPGQRGRLNLTKAGTYQIYCAIHAPMRGSITVTS
jgi:plastocyanin